MSAVRRWNLFLRAVIVAIGILFLGMFLLRAEVIKDPGLALWPASGMLHFDGFQGERPLSSWAQFAAVQVAIWTALLYLLFSGIEAIRRSASRKP